MGFYDETRVEKVESNTPGLKLSVRTNLADYPQANLIIVHGLAEFSGRYDRIASYFVKQGYNVFRYDQLGHGESDGERGYLSSPDDLSENLTVIVNLVKKRYPNLSLFVLGHSMGGETVLLHAAKHPHTVDGYIATDPASVCIHSELGSEMIDGDPKKLVPNELGDGLNTDQRVIDKYNASEMNLHEITIGIYNNAIYKGALYLRDNLQNIVDPILLMQGLEDGIISYKDSMEVYPKMSSKDKEFHVYPFLHHEILNEPSRNEELFAEIEEWLHKRIY
ncbi:lysophospholipase [Lactobacillus sp. ESL0791]|uniref:alpha/beta hydrolase n=1 Tax=Lactobacillus sp. ESL0791 TaxID=2983234 RepID=UPI0023F9B1F0|nr:alpha/beta hydrolase [Lactobacillus sp. ESL0791]MDF7638762.1 lysophospholipase [Lactobacillus sp. ESL0791]